MACAERFPPREGGHRTKSSKPRVVDLDLGADGVLDKHKHKHKHKRDRGSLALELVRPDALIFGDIEGQHRNPEHVSRPHIVSQRLGHASPVVTMTICATCCPAASARQRTSSPVW
jgi:hypothetical protein